MKYIKQIIFILYFFLSTSSLCFAQKENDTVAKKERRVHFKIYYSPDFCFRVNNSKIAGIEFIRPQSGDGITYNSDQEISRYGQECGILTDLRLIKHLLLVTGLSFEEMGYKTKQIDTAYGVYFGGPAPNYKIWDNMSIKYRYLYISLPLMFEYQNNTKKIYYNFSGGVALDYLISYKRTAQYANLNTTFWLPREGWSRKEIKLKENPFYVSCLIGTEISFRLNKNLRLFFQPHFKYIFGRFGKKLAEDNEPNLYSIGLSVGIKL